MRPLSAFLVAVCICLSCKKDDLSPYISAVLTHHTWYPYKMRIITDDTMITSVVNNYVITDSKTKIIHLDTTMILDQCMQSVTYQFQANGRLLINDPCYPTNSNVDTTWSLLSNRFLRSVTISYPESWIYYKNHFGYLYFIVDSTYSYWPSLGNISLVTANEFLYNNNNSGGYTDQTAWNNSVNTDTLHKQSSHMFTTFKSK